MTQIYGGALNRIRMSRKQRPRSWFPRGVTRIEIEKQVGTPLHQNYAHVLKERTKTIATHRKFLSYDFDNITERDRIYYAEQSWKMNSIYYNILKVFKIALENDLNATFSCHTGKKKKITIYKTFKTQILIASYHINLSSFS